MPASRDLDSTLPGAGVLTRRAGFRCHAGAVGRQGSRKRKAARHLPKVKGNPGRLWGDLPTPWVVGSESAQRWVGRAGPTAQDAYFRQHPRLAAAFRVAAFIVVATALVVAVAVVLR